MKKIINIFSIFALTALTFLSACEKETPLTIDSVAPTVRITISGPGGVNEVFTQDGDYRDFIGSLNLLPLSTYNISVTCYDTSGMKNIRLTLANFLDNPSITGTPNPTESSNSLNNYFEVETVESAPYTSMILSGSFVTPDASNTDYSFYLSVDARDFRPNVTRLIVNTNVSDNPVGGYGWVLN